MLFRNRFRYRCRYVLRQVCGRVENPRLSRTVDEAPTDLPSRRETRPHTPGCLQLKMRYVKVVGGKLGSGQFRTVHKAIDVDSGKFMAVKILEQPTRKSKQEEWRMSIYYALKREVETLSDISHVSTLSNKICFFPLIRTNPFWKSILPYSPKKVFHSTNSCSTKY
jgi:hypothetical protein